MIKKLLPRDPGLLTAGAPCFPIALWSSGLVTTPSPLLLVALLAMTIFGGLALLTHGALWRRRLSALLGVAMLTAALLFLTLFFLDPFATVMQQQRPSTVAGDAPRRLRVISFNVDHGYPDFARQERRQQLLLAALRALQPDIVVLQEAWNTTRHGHLAAQLGAALDMDVAYARANGSRRLIGFEEGSAILSRYPILSAERFVLAPAARFWERRIALAATLSLGAGPPLAVVGTHLSFRRAAGDGQADHLARLLPRERPLILAGDLNARAQHRALEVFQERGLHGTLQGGIDHILFDAGASSWAVHDMSWTLRPADLGALIGVAERLSNHPGLCVDLRRGPL